METKIKKAINRSNLLPLLGRELQCKAVFSHVIKKDNRYFALLLEVIVGVTSVDHVWVEVQKGFMKKRLQTVEFIGSVRRYDGCRRCGLCVVDWCF